MPYCEDNSPCFSLTLKVEHLCGDGWNIGKGMQLRQPLGRVLWVLPQNDQKIDLWPCNKRVINWLFTGAKSRQKALEMKMSTSKIEKALKKISAFYVGSSTWARTRDLRINRKPGFWNTNINQRLIWVKIDRVINRVIPNFVALCNKLVFCPIFTRSEVKNQVGEGDFTLLGLTARVTKEIGVSRSAQRNI